MEKSVPAPPVGDTDEADLVRLAQEDPSTFAALYQLYLSRVYNYVRARLASEEEAADLTQQIFLQALNALPAYQARGTPFAAWLFQIARNAVIDHYRRRKSFVSWDALLIHRERLARLKPLVARLTPFERELLALRFAAGLSSPEIAQVVGKSPAAVKKQLTRLLHALKEQYSEQ